MIDNFICFTARRNLVSFYCLIFLCFVSKDVLAQQYPQYTQYNYNMNVINPAYVGSKDNLKINVLGRSQWTGVEGAPKTATLVIDSPLKENFGLGFSAIYDQLGPVKETHLYADFSHTLQVSQLGKLALGLKGGFSFQSIDTSLLNFNNEELTPLNTLDSKASPNLGFGMYYYQELFYVGFSVPNLLNLGFSENNIDAIGTVAKETAFYLTSGYLFPVSDNIVLKPSFLLRVSTEFPTLLDMSLAAFFNEKFELGLSYRTNQTVSLTSLFSVNDYFRLGYAYDYSINELSNFNNGSHEIIMLFDLNNNRRKSGSRYLHCF